MTSDDASDSCHLNFYGGVQICSNIQISAANLPTSIGHLHLWQGKQAIRQDVSIQLPGRRAVCLLCLGHPCPKRLHARPVCGRRRRANRAGVIAFTVFLARKQHFNHIYRRHDQRRDLRHVTQPRYLGLQPICILYRRAASCYRINRPKQHRHQLEHLRAWCR